MSSSNRSSGGSRDEDLVRVLGYLNFSSGKSDPNTLQAFNRLYGWAIASNPVHSPYGGMPAWLTLQQWLQDRLAVLAHEQPAFAENAQANQVLQLIWLDLLPEYLDFHRDLLFHQEPEGIFNGLFLGRAVEATLQQGPPWNESKRIVEAAIATLNDYVGFRPVAVLEGRRIEPYPHEWLRPVPLYVRDVGVAHGLYYDLINTALGILRETDTDLLHASHFDLERLEELALDPRAYDFDHPVNKRPNYHFGQWDPHCIDQRGAYTRFIVQQVTVDALMARVKDEKELPKSELLFEAAAVLAGTLLMASGVSGWGPTCFSSTVTLGSLMETIASNRDQFYESLIARMNGPHAERLVVEQRIRRQPFGGARQHLNTHLARLRASQLEHVMLARLYAKMGCATTAKDQSDFVHVPSARIQCRIDCMLTSGIQFQQQGRLEEAIHVVRNIREYVDRGIQCGAIVDPWNIMGFAGNFSLFHGPESAIHDHRVDNLVETMEEVFAFQARLWREAAASDNAELCEKAETDMRSLNDWWRKYAAHEVADLEATDPKASLESAELVARALQLWHRGGASAGDIRFWAPHAAMFDSPKAYALVVEALLERHDFVASMALLVHWLSEVNRVGLQSGNISFSDLARLWLDHLCRSTHQFQGEPFNTTTRWTQIQKFFDYIEANGDWLCEPPQFRLNDERSRPKQREDGTLLETGMEETDEESESREQFGSAYEDVVYQDSTNDGVDGEIFEEETDSQDELAAESKRLCEHLAFIQAMASMWKQVALSPKLFEDASVANRLEKQLEALERWCEQAASHRQGLLALVHQICNYRIRRGGADQDSMARYDRKRVLKEALLERVIATAIDVSDSRRLLLSAILSHCDSPDRFAQQLEQLPHDDAIAVRLFSHLMAGRRSDVEEQFTPYLNVLRGQGLLYLPLARGGDPEQIFNVRLRRRVLSHLLAWLPRQGLFFQCCQLLETARYMEHHHPVGPGAVTEFDELFQLAYKAMVQAVIRNAFAWNATRTLARKSPPKHAEWSLAADPQIELEDLVDHSFLEPASDSMIPVLEQLTELLLSSWLSHSRTLRLSVLEMVDNPNHWKRLVAFIERFGSGLFTQNFLKLGNVRAILHQGVGTWLEQARQDGDHEEVKPILEAIDRQELKEEEALRWLDVVLEAVIDHYSEYRDYNSTTTQSDRGEMLYMLLDFLRLRVRYDRVSWNLRPVFWAHEILVRSGCSVTAVEWRQALADRIGREADQYVEQLKKLQEQYAMKMPTVADRLGERFIKPMTIDRLRALIRPAMKQLSLHPDGKAAHSFQQLVEEATKQTSEPTGVGLDIPQWLLALGEEVENQLESRQGLLLKSRAEQSVPMLLISAEAIESQLNAAARQNRMLN